MDGIFTSGDPTLCYDLNEGGVWMKEADDANRKHTSSDPVNIYDCYNWKLAVNGKISINAILKERMNERI